MKNEELKYSAAHSSSVYRGGARRAEELSVYRGGGSACADGGVEGTKPNSPAGGNSLPPSGYSLYKQRESWSYSRQSF